MESIKFTAAKTIFPFIKRIQKAKFSRFRSQFHFVLVSKRQIIQCGWTDFWCFLQWEWNLRIYLLLRVIFRQIFPVGRSSTGFGFFFFDFWKKPQPWPGERRISPAQNKKKSSIRRPRFFIRRPKCICKAIIKPIELRIRRPNFRNSPQPSWRSPTKQKQSKIPGLSSRYFMTTP